MATAVLIVGLLLIKRYSCTSALNVVHKFHQRKYVPTTKRFDK